MLRRAMASANGWLLAACGALLLTTALQYLQVGWFEPAGLNPSAGHTSDAEGPHMLNGGGSSRAWHPAAATQHGEPRRATLSRSSLMRPSRRSSLCAICALCRDAPCTASHHEPCPTLRQITPTYARKSQLVDLHRLSHSLHLAGTKVGAPRSSNAFAGLTVASP
jgi:hypothetical protein